MRLRLILAVSLFFAFVVIGLVGSSTSHASSLFSRGIKVQRRAQSAGTVQPFRQPDPTHWALMPDINNPGYWICMPWADDCVIASA